MESSDEDRIVQLTPLQVFNGILRRTGKFNRHLFRYSMESSDEDRKVQ
jgi:hypothetical protein